MTEIFDFRDFQKKLGEWQRSTFPASTHESKFKHLLKEIKELEENMADGTEMADIIMLVVGMADIQGIDISSKLQEKFEINKQRKWGTPDEFGVVHHVK